MKKTLSISTLFFLLVFMVAAASAQQPMSAEKKRAMHKLDPVDIFPQVQERSGKERNLNKRSANSLTADLSNSSATAEQRTSKRRSSRRHRSSDENLQTDIAANASQTPAITQNNAEPEPMASPAPTPDSSITLNETANNKPAPPQTLAAIGNPPGSGNSSQNSMLSLPIILALLVLVLIALVLAFAKLIRYLRGPVV